ncbi:MAG: class I SAM-dependent methyltransferase [Rhodanobacteraceae bacterium]|nr:class I SAM-dependent methyltransferase [Rhodanobacteraceae bacterium]
MSAQHDDRAAMYGEGCAEFYDEIYAPATRIAVERLAALAAEGPVLEAGVGTGRYALPLATRGIAVHGIDASAAMLSIVRSKAGSLPITTTLADFSTTAVAGTHRLVICLTNTLTLLPDAVRQSQAVAHFAAALDEQGSVLIETTHVVGDSSITLTDVMLDTRRGKRRYRAECRHVDTTHLDLWAAEAGLRRIARWRDWHRRPWNGEQGNVLSLYRKRTQSQQCHTRAAITTDP